MNHLILYGFAPDLSRSVRLVLPHGPTIIHASGQQQFAPDSGPHGAAQIRRGQGIQRWHHPGHAKIFALPAMREAPSAHMRKRRSWCCRYGPGGCADESRRSQAHQGRKGSALGMSRRS
jgi:hypothetical protein